MIFLWLTVVGGMGAPAPGSPAAAELGKILAYQQGIEALDGQLPELASKRFREALGQPGMAEEVRREIAIRLAEALVRDGKSADALTVLEPADLTSLPEGTFWKAQALAGVGQLEAATSLLATAQAPGLPFATEACFTRASLLLALGRADEALATMNVIAAAADHPARGEALLRQAGVQFDLGKFPEARALLSEVSAPPPALAIEAKYLDARLLLQEVRLAEAAARFSEILEAPDPVHQSLRLRHSAALGLADATAAAGDRQAAADALLLFVEKNPATPLLAPAFQRLALWMAAAPDADDPILLRVRQWATPDPIVYDPLLNASLNDGALSAFPRLAAPSRELAGHALFFLAQIMRDTSPAAAASAVRRLALDFPDHPLTREALLGQAEWMIDHDRPADAATILATLDGEKTIADPDGKSALLAARAEYLAGNFAIAAEHFERASAGFSADKARAAAVDAAISRLRAGDIKALQTTAIQDAALRAAVELEQALFLAASSPADALPVLNSFLAEHAAHPRVAEARMALAASALEIIPADPAMARSQLDHPDMGRLAVGSRGRAVLLRLRVEELARQWTAAIPIAQEFLAQNPGAPEAPLVTLKLGEALFRNKDYNAARLAMQTLATAHPDSPLAEVALFHSARAATLGGTPQSQEESLALYDQVIARNGPLCGQAQVRKIRALIDLNRAALAATFARETLAKLPAESDLRQPVELLLAEALFAAGTPNDPRNYEEALTIYTGLLASNDLPAALAHRLHYLRGLTLEQLKRDGEALDSYYQVLETRDPGESRTPEEWYQFERTAFKGLSLLEARGRWQAAVAFAEKIAGFQGPRSREAAERAKKLRLEHFIWE